jgi:hypothetical protein
LEKDLCFKRLSLESSSMRKGGRRRRRIFIIQVTGCKLNKDGNGNSKLR